MGIKKYIFENIFLNINNKKNLKILAKVGNISEEVYTKGFDLHKKWITFHLNNTCISYTL